jgi:tRNA 2-thiouridine synthesizing protein D
VKLRYCLLVTGPAYGTQQASSAFQFANALLALEHTIDSVFFYRDGVLNANALSSPASDEFDMVRAWQQLAKSQQFSLNVCVAAALRRGIVSQQEADELKLMAANLQSGFVLSGLGALAQASLSCDRVVQF